MKNHRRLFIALHQKTQAELESLDQEHTKLQQKHDAAKARNKVLASELKGLKAQVQTLLEKGAHDDELIAALMVMLTEILGNMAAILIIFSQLAIMRRSGGRLVCIFPLLPPPPPSVSLITHLKQ